MTKLEKLQKFIDDAQNFIGKNITSNNSKFEAWNNSLLRFIEKNYDKTTRELFRNRRYSLSVWTFSTPESDFVDAFEQDMQTTIEDLKLLLEEEQDNIAEEINIETEPNCIDPLN